MKVEGRLLVCPRYLEFEERKISPEEREIRPGNNREGRLCAFFEQRDLYPDP